MMLLVPVKANISSSSHPIRSPLIVCFWRKGGCDDSKDKPRVMGTEAAEMSNLNAEAVHVSQLTWSELSRERLLVL